MVMHLSKKMSCTNGRCNDIGDRLPRPCSFLQFTLAVVVITAIFMSQGTTILASSLTESDCSSEAICLDQVRPELATVKGLLIANGFSDVQTCTAGLPGRFDALLLSGCVNTVVKSVLLVLAAWLPSTQLCRDISSSGSQCALASQLLNTPVFQSNLTDRVRELCTPDQLLNPSINYVSNHITNHTRQVTEFIVHQIHVPDTDSMVLQAALLKNLTFTIPALTATSSLLASFAQAMNSILVTLQGYSLPNTQQFQKQIVLQICAAVYPTCRCSRKEQRATSSVPPNITLTTIKPCYWSCLTIKETISLAEAFLDADAVAVMASPLFVFLQAIAVCAEKEELKCLDPSCKDTALNNSYVCSKSSLSFESAALESQQICVLQGNRCVYPLQETAHSSRYSPDVQNAVRSLEGLVGSLLPGYNTTLNVSILPCAEACTGVMFNERQESQLRKVVIALTSVTLIIEIFAMLSFFINRNKLNRFPTRILAYISVSFFFVCLSILAQVSAGWKQIVCYEDGTLHLDLPKTNDGSGWCVFNAVVIFAGLMSALLWWLCLSHAWFTTFQALTTPSKMHILQDKLSFLEAGYHVFVWTSVVILTTVFLLLGKIDGVAMFGLCFTIDRTVWFWFLTMSNLIVGVAGTPFLARGLYELSKAHRSVKSMKLNRKGGRSKRDATHLRRFQTKLGIVMVMSFINLIAQFAVGLYQNAKWSSWLRQIEQHVACSLLACEEQRNLCPPLPEPSFGAFITIALTILLEGIALASWALTRDNMNAWVQFYHSPLEVLRYGIPMEGKQRRKSTDTGLSDSDFRKSSFFRTATRMSLKRGSADTDTDRVRKSSSSDSGRARKGSLFSLGGLSTFSVTTKLSFLRRLSSDSTQNGVVEPRRKAKSSSASSHGGLAEVAEENTWDDDAFSKDSVLEASLSCNPRYRPHHATKLDFVIDDEVWQDLMSPFTPVDDSGVIIVSSTETNGILQESVQGLNTIV